MFRSCFQNIDESFEKLRLNKHHSLDSNDLRRTISSTQSEEEHNEHEFSIIKFANGIYDVSKGIFIPFNK
jgi:hypothetical protein